MSRQSLFFKSKELFKRGKNSILTLEYNLKKWIEGMGKSASKWCLWISMALLSLTQEGRGDWVVVGGYGVIGEGCDAPSEFIADSFILGETNFTPFSFPPGAAGQIDFSIIDPIRGTIIFSAAANDGTPLLYRGSVVSSSVTQLSIEGVTVYGYFYQGAFTSDGTAILVGASNLDGTPPLVYRIGPNDTTAIPIPISGSDEGSLFAIGIMPNDVAVMGGQDLSTSFPLVYLLYPNANSVTPLSVPGAGSDQAYINTIAITPDGTAVLGGGDDTLDEAIMYTLPLNSETLQGVSIPDEGDGGDIIAAATAPDGSAIFVGYNGSGPLIYHLPSGSHTASIIANPSGVTTGNWNALAIGTDGTAVIGGNYSDTPLVCRLPSGATQAIQVSIPANEEGTIFSVAMGTGNIAVLVGQFYDSQYALIYTMASSASSVTDISFPVTLGAPGFNYVAIYPFDGTYDIRRIRAYYYFNQGEAISELTEAGIL